VSFLSKEESNEEYSHFGEISEMAKDFAINTALLDSRYIFVTRVKGEQKGYCTHCKTEFKTPDLKHNEITNCPHCRSYCQAKQAGLGRMYMTDDAYFVHFEKSLINPEAVTAIGYYVRRDYSGDYKNVKTAFERLALYIFETGTARMYSRSIYETETGFKKSKSIYSIHATTAMGHKDGFLSLESVEKAVKDTPFQYSTWERHDISDLIRFFGLYVKSPGVELLAKIGLLTAVRDKLKGVSTYRSINWQGKNLTSLLRLNKHDWKDIPNCKSMFTAFHLHILQEVRKEGSKLTLLEVNVAVARLSLASYMDPFDYLRQYTNIRKIFKYAQKQYDNSTKGTYYTAGSVLSTWRDYLRESIEMDLDLTDHRILFPKDVHASHQRNIERKKVAADEALNERIKDRVKELSKYRFQFNQFFIRPAESAQELVAEGEKLKHCVGGYSKEYANGRTNIFFIRHIEDPSEPFFTVELKKGIVTQCYGRKSSVPYEDVEAFLEAFKIAKLGKKKSQLVAV
jgi:hypothetical protein